MAREDTERSADLLQAVERYYHAMVTADETTLRALFEPRATIMGHFEGEFQWLTLDDFVAEAKSLVGQHGAHDTRLESLRMDGDIASVSVSGRYAGAWIVDHLLLVEIDGTWIITSKSFHVRS
ncbi:nuclear transport factor 2 family protein [Seohaeicola saemankumensis]|nr:nuclear transport factor 2 family protein [Seohaeicola saemankumensis]MCA0871316.1 nuclear transport factor 2 family protein [Seohaeicola saemankumensis]